MNCTSGEKTSFVMRAVRLDPPVEAWYSMLMAIWSLKRTFETVWEVRM